MAMVPVVSARVAVPSPRPSQIGQIRPTHTSSTTTCSKRQRELVSPLAGAARVFAEYRLDTIAAKEYLERGVCFLRVWGNADHCHLVPFPQFPNGFGLSRFGAMPITVTLYPCSCSAAIRF